MTCALTALLSLLGCASASALNLTGVWSADYDCESGPCPGGGPNFPATDTLTQAEGSEEVTGTNSSGETIEGTLTGNQFVFHSTKGAYKAEATLTVAPDGLSWTGPAEDSNGTKGTYTAERDPTITGVGATSGSEAGGTEVSISGAGFREGATVHFGSRPAASVTFNSSESITATTPPASASSRVDVTVTTSVGTSEANPLYHFRWVHVPPKQLGGMNVAGYCESIGDHGNGGGPVKFLRGGVEGPEGSEYAYKNWACVEGSGAEVEIATSGPDPSMANLCAMQYPGVPSYGYPDDPDNAFTWNCYESLPPEGKHGGGETLAKTSSLVTPIVTISPLIVPPPVLARTGNIAPVSGKVLVKVLGSRQFVPLQTLRQVKFGSVIDATHGTVSVTTALPGGKTQTGQFFAGEFILRQERNGLVVAELTGGNFSVCPTKRERAHIARVALAHAHAAASGKHVVRKLWANAHGKFSTKGNYAAGAVQGTEWLTEDLCEGTLIRVTRDKVEVTNLVKHRHVLVKVGHKYLAKAP